MAKIPLRTYVKNIENLIERGNIEQAIAHAKNILQTYPKHIDTYRLLGKAYLESQRYSEAADILQRVLSVHPDDFVSHIGMSIIREDEGNKDAAIWHMERAYEIQPFNPAVQDELRRLYGSRDGVEPPRIRLTRGALVRMYGRGELYQQAIAEIQAALAEEPNRYDLRVLLARMYYQSGQRVEAAETCTALLAKLPYCYEANRILAEVLPGTSRAEDAQIFRQRMYALDPYEAFVSPTTPSADQVPDQAVMVEEFVLGSAETALQAPDWTRSAGITWEEAPEEELPGWLNTLGAEHPPAPPATREQPSTPPAEPPQAQPAAEDVIPDWMKAAGWGVSEGQTTEMPPAFEEAEPEEEATPAEIPDWLQQAAPLPESPEQQTEEQERLGWLESILPGQEPESPDLPDLGAPGGPPVDLFQQPKDTAMLSEDADWLAGLGETSAPEAEPAAAQSELPDWLAGAAGQESEAAEAEMPDWLKSIEPDASAAETAELPDWLQSAAAAEPEQPQPGAEQPQPAAEQSQPAAEQAESTFDFQIPTGEEPEAPAAETPSVAPVTPPTGMTEYLIQQEQAEESTEAAPAADMSNLDAAMAWLESLAAKQGADEATLITPPEQRTETLPDWLEQQVEEPASAAEPPAAAEGELPEWLSAAQPEASEPAPVEETPPTAEEAPVDADSAFAWLESLAAKQGADEATLITPPEQRTETPPDWLEQQVEEPASTAEPPAAAEGELPEWLSAAESETPEQRTEALPEWLLEEEEKPVEEPFVPVETQPAEESPAEASEPTGWAPEFAEPAEEAPAEPPEWRPEPEPAQTIAEPESTVDDWLRGLEVESEAEKAELPGFTPVEEADYRSQWMPAQEPAAAPSIQPSGPVPGEINSLTEAQTALMRGSLDAALDFYNRCIQEGRDLDTVIHDLRDALYRYPVDISLWQALGDAFARNNQLQEALDAYTKAEELLR